VLLALGLLVQSLIQAGATLGQHTQIVLGHVDRIRALIEEGSRAATSPQTNRTAERLASVRRNVNAQLAALHPLVKNHAGMSSALSALSGAALDGLNLLDRYSALVRAHRTAQARALAAAPATHTLGVRLESAYGRMADRTRRDELSRIAALRLQTMHLEIALITAAVVGIVLTLFVAGRFGVAIATRLGHLAENARRLARGEDATPLLGNDEFADLDLVYQAMMRQIAREQQVNATLQRMLLPQKLPAFDGIRIDTGYVPAARQSEVGGDWYDAFALSDRCICISIGDVAGHGLRAAAVMGAARIAVRTAARMHDDPGKIVEHLNRVIYLDEPDTMVTAFVALLDIDDGTLRYAVAGHPEPMIIRSDGETDLLPGRGIILGADPDTRYETFRAEMQEGWALLLYTDGLVEITHDYLRGVDELRQAASEEFASSAQNIAEAIQNRVLGGRASEDDAALLFVGVTRLGIAAEDRTHRSWTLDARDAESAHRAKRAILWHLGDAIRDPAQLATIELVLGELIGNVARHSPGLAEVTLAREDTRTLIRVSDRGKPFPYRPNGAHTDLLAESGRGLFLVRAMSRDLRVEHSAQCNVVTAVLNGASS